MTADHCVDDGQTSVPMKNNKGKEFSARVIQRGRSFTPARIVSRFGNKYIYDWTLLKVDDVQYHSAKWLGLNQGAQPTRVFVQNAGFGSLRVFEKPGEIQTTKKLFVDFLRTLGKENSREARETDIGNYIRDFDRWLEANSGSTGVLPISRDSAHLKLEAKCEIFRIIDNYSGKYDNIYVWNSCPAPGGNSGSALVDLNGNVVGVQSKSFWTLGTRLASYTRPGYPESMAVRVDLIGRYLPGSGPRRDFGEQDVGGGAAPAPQEQPGGRGSPPYWGGAEEVKWVDKYNKWCVYRALIGRYRCYDESLKDWLLVR